MRPWPPSFSLANTKTAGGPNDLAALSDHDIVLLGNYLLEHYGRPGVAVTAQQVAEVRRGGPSSSLVTLARAGVAVAAIALILIVLFMVFRTIKRRSGIA
jgi:fructose 5-dehydrogenase cytochrome subunit